MCDFGSDQCGTITCCLQVPGFWSRMTDWWQQLTWPSAIWLPNKEVTASLLFPNLPFSLEELGLINEEAHKLEAGSIMQSTLPDPVQVRLTWAGSSPALQISFAIWGTSEPNKQQSWDHISFAPDPNTKSALGGPNFWTETLSLAFPSWSMPSTETGTREMLMLWTPSKAA